MSWKAIGAEIGLSGPVVYRAVVKGKIPRSRAVRRALGLLPPRKPAKRVRRKRLWQSPAWRSACVSTGWWEGVRR